MNRWLKIVSVLAAAALLIGALYRSNDAANTARDLVNKRIRDAQVTEINNYKRAISACESSTQLRSLLNDLDTIIVNASNPTPALAAFSQRIHVYTDTNPNCKNLPPKPKGA